MLDFSKLQLDSTGTYVALCEIPEGIYNPPFDLQGKTVLDVGATCGEVAYWFITQCHAEKVICIESDPKSLPFLIENQKLMNIEVVAEDFNVDHLRRFKVDFIKCDVEGYEMVLLEYVGEGGVLPACSIEAHTNWIRDQFLKAGFKQKFVTNDTRVQVAAYIMTNYKSLGLK
jgi:hypothetical protein